jgi:GH15 family glucan-1,4-alpha-glucosidase
LTFGRRFYNFEKMKKILLFLFLIFPSKLLSHEVDMVEHMFGATNINAFTGNGGLTAGFSENGEITVLRWPSPGFYDHLNYFTPIIPVDAGYHAYDLTYMGAKPNTGIFSGIKVGNEVKWLRDLPSEQSYIEDTPIILNRFSLNGKEIIQKAFVSPYTDVLVLHYEVPQETGSLIFYENLAPCNRKAPYLPLLDWYDDENNDFLSFYEDGLIFHMTPEKKDISYLEEIFSVPEIERKNRFSEFIEPFKKMNGVWFGIKGSKSPSSYQVGHDLMTKCPYSKMWVDEPLDAFVDARDGVLKGYSVGGCQTNSALEFPFNEELTIIIAVSDSYYGVRKILDEIGSRAYDELERETEEFWRNWLSRAKNFDRFFRRTLISIKLAQDRNTGAIVASISTQPPYGQDWPRDGAFINLALDVAGYHEMVTKHNLFYRDVQRKSGVYPFGRGTYDMCYYPDGMPGGPIPFEIDETALTIWTLWTHAKFMKDGRDEYIREVKNTIELSAEALYGCYDEKKKLQCIANEDDNPFFTQGLQGAVTYYLAMKTAYEFFSYLGEKDKAEKFLMRAEEVKTGIMENLYSEDGFKGSYGEIAWLLWPAEIKDGYDEKMVAEYLLSEAERCLKKEYDGFAYISKGLLALALTHRDDYLTKLNELKEILINEVPTPNTMHLGEVVVIRNGEFFNRVAIPHIWEASLSLLFSTAMDAPEAFSPLKEELVKEGGCGCAESPSPSFPVILTFFIFIFRNLWKRKNS